VRLRYGVGSRTADEDVFAMLGSGNRIPYTGPQGTWYESHRPLLFARAGKVLLAAQHLAPGAQHLVVDKVGVVGTQQLARGLRQVEDGAAVLHRHQLRQRLHVIFQRAVERLAGDALRDQPGQRQADRPQQQQRGQHPVEDLAEQRALLALENLHPGIFSRQ